MVCFVLYSFKSSYLVSKFFLLTCWQQQPSRHSAEVLQRFQSRSPVSSELMISSVLELDHLARLRSQLSVSVSGFWSDSRVVTRHVSELLAVEEGFVG